MCPFLITWLPGAENPAAATLPVGSLQYSWSRQVVSMWQQCRLHILGHAAAAGGAAGPLQPCAASRGLPRLGRCRPCSITTQTQQQIPSQLQTFCWAIGCTLEYGQHLPWSHAWMASCQTQRPHPSCTPTHGLNTTISSGLHVPICCIQCSVSIKLFSRPSRPSDITRSTQALSWLCNPYASCYPPRSEGQLA